MTRKRKCSSTPHIDEGSSSMTAPSEAPWFGRAIFTHQPNQHWKKPAPNVIAHFDGLMKATNQNLATIHRYKRRGRLLLKKQRHMPLHCNYVEGEFEILLQRLKAKVNRISRKLKLFHIRSQSIIQENEVENRMNSITDGGESCSLNVTIVNNLKDIYRIQLEVRDDTDESDFVLLDHLAESILGLTAKKLYELNGNETEIPPVLVMNLMDKSMKIQVQVNEYNIRIARNEFTITKILDAPKEHVENLGESPPSSDSLKSCVSNLGTTSSKLSTVIEKAGKKFKGAAVTYNDEMEDEFSDDAALATMRKKQRKYHISDDE
ncbi:hypothetical protein LINPERHAP1_LOCUS1579 [Linum perenne]